MSNPTMEQKPKGKNRPDPRTPAEKALATKKMVELFGVPNAEGLKAVTVTSSRLPKKRLRNKTLEKRIIPNLNTAGARPLQSEVLAQQAREQDRQRKAQKQAQFAQAAKELRQKEAREAAIQAAEKASIEAAQAESQFRARIDELRTLYPHGVTALNGYFASIFSLESLTESSEPIAKVMALLRPGGAIETLLASKDAKLANIEATKLESVKALQVRILSKRELTQIGRPDLVRALNLPLCDNASKSQVNQVDAAISEAWDLIRQMQMPRVSRVISSSKAENDRKARLGGVRIKLTQVLASKDLIGDSSLTQKLENGLPDDTTLEMIENMFRSIRVAEQRIKANKSRRSTKRGSIKPEIKAAPTKAERKAAAANRAGAK